MAESTWPDPATTPARQVSDIQYEQLAVAGYLESGVVGTSASGAAFADSTGRQVKIKANTKAIIRGRMYNSGTTDIVKAVTANTSGSIRIDLLVLQLDRATWRVTSVIKAGTPGAGVPALQQDLDTAGAGAGKWEIPLAVITVVNNASTLNPADVVCVAPYLYPASTIAAGHSYPGSGGIGTAFGGALVDSTFRTGPAMLRANYRYSIEAHFPLAYSAVSDVITYNRFDLRKSDGATTIGTIYTPPTNVYNPFMFHLEWQYAPTVDEVQDFQIWAQGLKVSGGQWNWSQVQMGAGTFTRVRCLGPAPITA